MQKVWGRGVTRLRSVSLTYAPDRSILVHVSYTHDLEAGSKAPNPGTKARSRLVSGLAREALTEGIKALDAGHVEVVGESGFVHREDVLSCEIAGGRGEEA